MNATSLRALFSDHITSDNQLILNSDLLPEAGTLAHYIDPDGGDSAQIVIDDALLDPDTTQGIVRGTATFLGVRKMEVTLRGEGDEDSTWLRLECTGIPDTWKFTDSVKDVPKYWASTPGEFGLELKTSFFADIRIQGASFVLSTKESHDGSEQPGLNLFGNLLLDNNVADGLAAGVLRWIQGSPLLPLAGTVALSEGGRPPRIDLRAALAITMYSFIEAVRDRYRTIFCCVDPLLMS